ncbi:MAG: HAD family hydrolase [Bacteroidales bacterium]|nr:HAD family hydrolase [Bacteroidales bacterium]
MTIIWDFNGTLLDDMQVCVGCMNRMLKERNLPPLDMRRYREIFTFPVRDYYLALGFDFQQEPFDIPAHQFIDLYRESLHQAPLHEDAEDLLRYFRQLGYTQIILSAMEQELLEETLESKGILNYFDQVAGITNHLGEGKLEMARELVKSLGSGQNEICLVGDTVHDYEVAKGSGIPCILVSQGHQSFERLSPLDCMVIKDLKDLKQSIPLCDKSQ